MLARHIACVAAPFEAAARGGIEAQHHLGAICFQTKLPAVELHLSVDIEIVLASRSQQALALGSKQLCGLCECQT